MTVKITADIPGYLSVADLPSAAERVLIVGTGQFQDVLFAGQADWSVGSGPNLVQPQTYWYAPSAAQLQATGTRRARGWILQMNRENDDATADDAVTWPADWPFSYLPHLGPPAIDFVKPGGTRGIRVKLATGDSILLGTHILKAVSVTDLVAGRLPFRP